jgi:hypothetical protein
MARSIFSQTCAAPLMPKRERLLGVVCGGKAKRKQNKQPRRHETIKIGNRYCVAGLAIHQMMEGPSMPNYEAAMAMVLARHRAIRQIKHQRKRQGLRQSLPHSTLSKLATEYLEQHPALLLEAAAEQPIPSSENSAEVGDDGGRLRRGGSGGAGGADRAVGTLPLIANQFRRKDQGSRWALFHARWNSPEPPPAVPQAAPAFRAPSCCRTG